jgi:hypothetical protein
MLRCWQSGAVRRYRAVNPAASISRCRCWARFAVAQDVQRHDPGLEATGIWRMSVETAQRRRYMVNWVKSYPLQREWETLP